MFKSDNKYHSLTALGKIVWWYSTLWESCVNIHTVDMYMCSTDKQESHPITFSTFKSLNPFVACKLNVGLN